MIYKYMIPEPRVVTIENLPLGYWHDLAKTVLQGYRDTTYWFRHTQVVLGRVVQRQTWDEGSSMKHSKWNSLYPKKSEAIVSLLSSNIESLLSDCLNHNILIFPSHSNIWSKAIGII